MSSPTTPPEAAEASPPARPRPVGNLSDLALFFAGAVALFLLVQFSAAFLLLYDTHEKNPGLTWGEVVEQVNRRVEYNAFFAIPVQIIYYALLLLLLYALVRGRRGLPFWSGLAMRPLPASQAGSALLAGAVLALVIQSANLLAPPPKELPFDRLFSSRGAAWLIIAASLLVAPLVEEVVFRGYLYTVLESLWGMAAAVLASGLLFGAIHFPQLYPGYFQMLLLCVVGIVFSLARARSGTLLASILLHFGYNATLSAAFLASEQFRKLASF